MFSEISARAQENFSGARVIRAYVQEEPEIAAFETSNREYINRSLKLVRLMGMLWPTLETMLGLAIVLVLWLGAEVSGQSTVDSIWEQHSSDGSMARRFRGLQHLHGATDLAGDRPGMGHQYLPARNRFDGTNQRNYDGAA